MTTEEILKTKIIPLDKYAIKLDLVSEGYCVQFKIFKHENYLFIKQGSGTCNYDNPNIEEAQSLISGFLKWDDCFQWSVDYIAVHTDTEAELEDFFNCIRDVRKYAIVMMGDIWWG